MGKGLKEKGGKRELLWENGKMVKGEYFCEAKVVQENLVGKKEKDPERKVNTRKKLEIGRRKSWTRKEREKLIVNWKEEPDNGVTLQFECN